MKIAIIGGGISGSTVLRELVESPLENIQIEVFEKRDKLVVGFPYDQDTQGAVMNEHAIDLSINPEHPEEFYHWLEKHQPDWADFNAFVPRQIYGQYLHDSMIQYYQAEKVKVVQQKVIDMNFQANKYSLLTEEDGWYDNYDAVFFTIGHPPYADLYNLYNEANYIHNPYPISKKLANLNKSDQIGIIGSGLTSLDILNGLLTEKNWDHPIQVFVPGEPFKTVKFTRYMGPLYISFNNDWIAQQLTLNNGRIPLDKIVDKFLADLNANEIDILALYEEYGTGSIEEIEKAIESKNQALLKLRLYIVKFTTFLPDLYNDLTPSDRDRYVEDYETIFNHFRSQMPASSLTSVLEWMEEGRLEIVQGIQHIIPENEGFTLQLVSGQTYHRDTMINAGGFELNLGRAAKFDPLLKNLYDREIFVPYYRKGIKVTWPECQIITASSVLEDAYLLGHWISSIHYGNNNIHLCMKQAARVADIFIQKHLKN